VTSGPFLPPPIHILYVNITLILWQPRRYGDYTRWSLQGLVINQFQGSEHEDFIVEVGFDGHYRWESVVFILLLILLFRITMMVAVYTLSHEKR